MDDKTILGGMIEVYQNDFMCGYQGEDKEKLRTVFLELIVYSTQYVNGYKYCGRPDCPCSPQSGIRGLLKAYYDEINEVLLGGNYGLSEVPMYLMRAFVNRFSNEGGDAHHGA